MSKGKPRWKLLLGIFSLFLTCLIWQQGLRASFDRPSVSPALKINQNEIALLASSGIPREFKDVLVGEAPGLNLRKLLSEIPQTELTDRQKLLLAGLESSEERSRQLLNSSFESDDYLSLKTILLNHFEGESITSSTITQLKKINLDPLLFQVSCFFIGGEDDICIDLSIARIAASKLLLSSLFPLIAICIGSILLIRQLWINRKINEIVWPEISSLPLTIVDMIILVSGGFVILGEVLSPILLLPISDVLIKDIQSPIRESIRVLLGYIAMSLPPLFILWQQIKSNQDISAPSEGWLQWKIKPLNTAFLNALKGWLMVMPIVLLTSWIVSYFWGDPGGSNPLLEMVLKSHSSIALSILFLTTVFIAPLFEELIFRGALLPVLVKERGRTFGIISSALIFALAHLSVGELPPLFVLGIGLALMRLITNRLTPCVIMHSLWNGVTFSNLLLLGVIS